MPPAFNRATFYSTFVLMHNIADHFSPPNCPSHCNLSPKSDNNVLSTGEQGSEIFFFLIKVGYSADLFGICLRDSGSERGALFLSISRRFNRARNYRKSQHPSRRRQITRQLEPPDRAKPRRSWNSAKIYAWKRAKMDDRGFVARLSTIDPYRDQQSFYQHRSPSRVDEYSRVNGTTRYPTAAIITRSLREFAGPSLQMDSLDINFINR